ncbi:MAG: ABC transporter ATP-binding protein [Haloferacaceae archaeon]
MSSVRDETTEPPASGTESEDDPLLEVRGLEKHFPVNTGFISSLKVDRSGGFPLTFDDTRVRAVDGVDFELRPGETFGVVGESGCGKSTLARTLVGLEQPTDGEIVFRGEDISSFDAESLRRFRKDAQIVFQDPQSSLNPRRKIGNIIADPLEAAGWDSERRRDRVLELLEDVGLERDFYNRYPHEFSGGQRQRINLARALSINPDLVIADEPVSGLDMSVQAQILTLMDDLQDEYGLTYLFITHDLSVIRQVADRIAVMYVGDFVETAPTSRLFSAPHHPYTRALLDAVPNPDPDARELTAQLHGDVPSPSDPPSGCKFHTRCPKVIPPEAFSRDAYVEYVTFKTLLGRRNVDPDADPGDYFETSLPREARDAVAEALSLAADDEWDAAGEALDEYQSVCESEVPALEQVGDEPRHASACHLPDEERETYSW